MGVLHTLWYALHACMAIVTYLQMHVDLIVPRADCHYRTLLWNYHHSMASINANELSLLSLTRPFQIRFFRSSASLLASVCVNAVANPSQVITLVFHVLITP